MSNAAALPESRLDSNARIMQRWRDAYGETVEPGIAAAKQAQ